MTSNFLDLNTHRIFYKIQGKGPRIVLVTGTNSDTRHTPTIYDVPGIEKFEVLNFDHRGMGQSTSPATDPTLSAYAEDIAKLLHHIGWEKSNIIGVSFGGMVAQHFAVSHPEMIDKLVLCCTSSGGKGGSSYPLHELMDLSAEEYAAFIMKKMNLKHTDAWQKSDPEKAKKAYEFYLKGAKGSHSTPEKLEAMKKQFAARANHDLYEELGSLPIETFIACGEDDGVAPVANSRALAARIPHGQLHIYKGGHLFLKEDAKAWPSILKFITGES
ncbi:alpha/beta fold hydrolase [Sneathiella limimaris]|uniref:alpha/beta fold hydrolase n=1 Tax=Sneathiella limimaris TaxID=1964213 RepID=UPI00146C06DA|nr:alpha/beta hydrolase [Sneathiella limimaris]